MRKFLTILGAVILFLLGLYFAFGAVGGLIMAREDPVDLIAILFFIPAGALIAVAIVIFKWARE